MVKIDRAFLKIAINNIFRISLALTVVFFCADALVPGIAADAFSLPTFEIILATTLVTGVLYSFAHP